ncbi:MAG: hypothetical protein ACI8PZ_000766 [Myxococcota bacterium]|jgi:hypothetical protein
MRLSAVWLLVLVGCGGSDKSDSGDTADDTVATGTGGGTATGGTATGTGGTATGGTATGGTATGGTASGTATGGTGTGTGGTDPTTTPTFTDTADILAASCDLQPGNVLRATCTVTRDGDGPVALSVNGPGFGGTRLFESDAEAAAHTLTLWGMLPNTTYSWVATAGAAELSGEVRTGALPADASVSVSVGGDPSGASVDGVFFRSCSESEYLVMYNPRGEGVAWYEDISTHAANPVSIYGYHWAEDDTVVVAANRDEVLVIGADGTLDLAFTLSDLGVDGLLHHDIYKANGYVFALYAYEQDGCILDGVAVVDASGALVQNLDLARTFDVPRCSGGGGGPGPGGGYWGRDLDGEDVSHANSVYVSPEGEMVISFRFFDTVIALDGDPTSRSFGEPLWALEGLPNDAFDPSFVIESAVTDDLVFAANHCAQRAPTGELTVFDNGLVGLSRAIVLDLDVDSGSAVITEVYEPGQACSVQSAIYKHTDGSALLTCASAAWFGEFDAGGGDVTRWTVEPTCAGGPGPGAMIPRGVPVNW